VPATALLHPVLLRRLVATTTAVLVSVGTLGVAAEADPVPAPSSVRAWGFDQFGETQPPASLSGKDVTAVSAGFLYTLALTSDGKVTGWGYNESGKSDVPPTLGDDHPVIAIAAGIRTGLALTSDGKVHAWGQEPNLPAALDDKVVTAISAGRSYLALTSDGEVIAWGAAGQNGGVNSVPASLAGQVVTAISTYESNAYAVADGKVTAWGYGSHGELDVPASLDDQTVTAVAAGGRSAMALTSEGKVVAWGDESTGGWDPWEQPTGQGVVPAVLDDKTVVAIASAEQHSLALTSDGQVVAWGYGGNGRTTTPGDVAAVTSIAAGYDHTVVAMAGTPPPAPAAFATGATATVSGTARVGQQLTADAGAIDPAADSVTYQWLADDVAIDGATQRTFILTAAQRGTRVSVRVTGSKAGYVSTSDTSGPTDEVSTDLVPDLDLTVAQQSLRRGQSTVLSWTSAEATTVTASGDWTGDRTSTGTVAVRPTRVGRTTYRLSATNENGTTTTSVVVQVSRQAKRLGATASGGLRRPGARVAVSASGFDAYEVYTIRIGGRTVVTGRISGIGHVTRSVVVPSRTPAGRVAVTVTGSEPDRVGTSTLRVVRS
jgi:Regulator of Chromosome Condensation (RCC1) repeat protein